MRANSTYHFWGPLQGGTQVGGSFRLVFAVLLDRRSAARARSRRISLRAAP